MDLKGAKPVTRVTCLMASCSVKKLIMPLLGGFLALGLAGCESSFLSSSSSDDVVSPTATVAADGAPVSQQKPIALAPVIGAPAKVSTKMNELLTASASQRSLTVVPPKEAEYTVRGYLVAAPDQQGTKLSYIWDISDKSNGRRKRLQGDELIAGKKGGDPWALVDDAAIQRVADKTADDLVNWLATEGQGGAVASAGGDSSNATASANTSSNAPVTTAAAPANEPQQQRQRRPQPQPQLQAAAPQAVQPAPQPQAAAPVQPKPDNAVLAAQTPTASTDSGGTVAVVPAVTGAPGDGEQSLTEAMRRYLRQAGVKLVDNGGPNAYTVRGSVQMGNAEGGQQPITIRWLVVDPSGKAMEKAVVQRNKVPEGSLDGSWGQVADLAASEAARSVAKLLIKPTG